MKNITFEEMLNMKVKELLSGSESNDTIYYYKNGDNGYHEIVELDLLRGRFVADNGDFSEFDWEIKESHIYIDEE